ncbi:fucose 4-O-acetylase, partial [Paenibacillus sp. 28ISP30-2]|nr:fucose 4-O-acetylase [Paenibacillus sp. 28ISP30-2]
MTTSHDIQGESFFLNLRFMLIICVFAGNALEPLVGSLHIAQQWFSWIFMFHMPLFVLVTGYFAKTSLAGHAGRKVLLQIGMQYLIFQTLY